MCARAAIASPDGQALLESLRQHAIRYFLAEWNPSTGLMADSTMPGAPSSIAATGMGLGMYAVAVEYGFLTREEAASRTLLVLQFLHRSVQSSARDATGYRGYYYHFLDMDSGCRAGQCELSTIDTALLLTGALTAAAYFADANSQEHEIRELAAKLYHRVDWPWALTSDGTLSHGWLPESGFLPYRWRGYDEAMILYLLALGSPTHAIPKESYQAWTATFSWRQLYEWEFLYAGPLFVHQYSQLWVDMRGLQDNFMREHGSDYFENSRRATLIQQQYAIRNPLGFKGYCHCCWGFTACHGPGPGRYSIDGVRREFLGYAARGVPDGPDDGTIAPWAAVEALPFCPEVVLPALLHFEQMHVHRYSRYGFDSTFNPTYPHSTGGWFCPWNYGIDQGAVGLMIENWASGSVWNLLRGCEGLKLGLRRAGFQESRCP